jgi:hypothetical protein
MVLEAEEAQIDAQILTQFQSQSGVAVIGRFVPVIQVALRGVVSENGASK